MRYLKLFEGFKEDFDIDYDELLKKCSDEFGDLSNGKFEVDWYLDVVEELYKKGGEVYRVVFLDEELNLDDNLGEHWTIDEGCFDRIYGNISPEQREKIPYLITAKIPPKFIDVQKSINMFKQLPQEAEVNLIKNPREYTIKKYVRK